MDREKMKIAASLLSAISATCMILMNVAFFYHQSYLGDFLGILGTAALWLILLSFLLRKQIYADIFTIGCLCVGTSISTVLSYLFKHIALAYLYAYPSVLSAIALLLYYVAKKKGKI